MGIERGDMFLEVAEIPVYKLTSEEFRKRILTRSVGAEESWEWI